ncbi:zinc ribbon domain-containing protein [Paenibacillus agricola]|uniref:Transposase n=1 Tax=Paenibacillus agricola TaxID=2716264 RepID=A0ABX0JCC3_9BACL|nr:zinc ribbon domain-containing protein [Paenibacillus agricola]NHN34079.1 transposase [Paenibacillus agricola]
MSNTNLSWRVCIYLGRGLCSNCGDTVKKALSVRVHRCDHCGYTVDGDENATRNMLQRALVSLFQNKMLSYAYDCFFS